MSYLYSPVELIVDRSRGPRIADIAVDYSRKMVINHDKVFIKNS